MERNQRPEEQIIIAQEEILKQCGLWKTPELKAKYAFRLSPDALVINPTEKMQLENLTELLYAQGGFFDGAIKLYQKTLDTRFSSTHVGGAIKRGLSASIPQREISLQGLNSSLPILSRVDLIKTLNSEGKSPNFMVAEVEGDKTHGFGYLTLMDYFRSEFIGSQDTRGIINTLKESLPVVGIDPASPIMLIVGQSERFYLTELQVFSGACLANGLNIYTVLENDVEVTNNAVTAKGLPESNILLNLPSFTPQGYESSGIEANKLHNLLIENKITCLIPPKRYLGSKALLALISNGDNNPEVEEVLKSVFDGKILDQLRNFIPQTILITKKNKTLVSNLYAQEPDNWVIKKTVSSGMKGVALPSDKEKSTSFIKTALNSSFNYIIQRKVNQAIEVFRYSEPSRVFLKSAPMYMRVELFSSPIGVATVGVTGREDPSVHGAKDAIQIPVIFK